MTVTVVMVTLDRQKDKLVNSRTNPTYLFEIRNIVYLNDRRAASKQYNYYGTAKFNLLPKL